MPAIGTRSVQWLEPGLPSSPFECSSCILRPVPPSSMQNYSPIGCDLDLALVAVRSSLGTTKKTQGESPSASKLQCPHSQRNSDRPAHDGRIVEGEQFPQLRPSPPALSAADRPPTDDSQPNRHRTCFMSGVRRRREIPAEAVQWTELRQGSKASRGSWQAPHQRRVSSAIERIVSADYSSPRTRSGPWPYGISSSAS